MTKTINGIRIATLTETQAAIINQARNHSSNDERKQIKREVFSVVKAKYGIPENFQLSANTTGEGQRGHLILHVGGKRNPQRGLAFRLGDDGKFDGTLVTRDELFPPPAPVVEQAADQAQSNTGGSVFDQGGADKRQWFRLDPAVVALALTCQDYDDIDRDMHGDNVPAGGEGGDLPTPHLMLHGRDDLAITADGSIYRKQ